MHIFRVGGSVRDEVMGLTPRDRDWVVVGATEEMMLERGFKKVGKAFSVFLHPESGEEYALARRVIDKRAEGQGFVSEFDPSVTIEEDLLHRDFTINAMAIDDQGKLIDPYGGQSDIKSGDGILRQVGDTFRVDPLRIVRCARFHAWWPSMTNAPELSDLIVEMVEEDDLAAVQPERIWPEIVKALSGGEPVRFIEVLRAFGALRQVLPEIDALFGVPQPEAHHPEVDTGVHVILTLLQAQSLTDDPAIRFAALVHDLGKAATPVEAWPQHIGHEEAGVKLVEQLTERLHAPNDYKELGVIASRWHCHIHRAKELRPATILKVLEAADAFKRPQRLEALLIVSEADARGRTGLEDRDYPQVDIMRRAFEAANMVHAKQLIEEGAEAGPKLGGLLRQRRIQAIKASMALAGRVV